MRQRSANSPLHAPAAVESTVPISRQRHQSTPDVASDIFNYVTDKAHAAAFGESPLWGSGIPKDKRFCEYGHAGTRFCQSVLRGTTRHTCRDIVVFSRSEEVKIVDAFPVQPSTRPLPPRSRFAKASRLLRCSSPVPQPTSGATGVAPHPRGMGANNLRLWPRGLRGCVPRWVWTALGPTTENEGASSSIAQNSLIRKRLVPAVNAVEHGCHGNINACCDDVRESP